VRLKVIEVVGTRLVENEPLHVPVRSMLAAVTVIGIRTVDRGAASSPTTTSVEPAPAPVTVSVDPTNDAEATEGFG
jgi:hypothetical protein